MSISRFLSLFGGLVASLFLAGCFETKQEFTLNPDGSGKVVHESKFQIMDISGAKRDAERQMRSGVAEVITKSKGVEAWRDVSYSLLEDGRVAFKGTAYFRNLSDLDIPNQTMLEFDWTPTAGGSAELTLRGKKDPDGKKAPAADGKFPSGQTAQKIKEGRAQYQQMKPMMAMIVGAMKHEVVFHLPGRASQVESFRPGAGGSLRLEFSGAKMLEAMEALINDDAWMARNSGSLKPEGTPLMDEEMSRLLFGGKGPARATVGGPGEPAFDYAAEVAAAQEPFATLRQELGASPAGIAAPAQSGALKSLQVVGVRLVRSADENLGQRPFNAEPGYTLALLAELPGSVLALTDECGLDTAVADDGSDLLSESEWGRRISFPHLSDDKTRVLFEAALATPGPGVKGVKELSGLLQYTVAGTTKDVDLGFAKLAKGARGQELGALLESISGDAGGPQQVELQLELKPAALKAMYVVARGVRTELDRRGYSGFDETYAYTFVAENGFPAGARLVAEIYAELQVFNAPFKIENITLLGEPAN